MAKYCYHCMSMIKDDDTASCPYCGRRNDEEVPLHHIKPGTVLDRKFLVGMAIGEGGFGITYIGRDLNLDIKVAIKEYYPVGYVNRYNIDTNGVTNITTKNNNDFFETGKEKFLQEARILARFSGEPGIVDVRDFFEENNTVYIAMEYLEGKDLKQYLKEVGCLSPAQTFKLMLPVMQTLTKVHTSGVIHRDISPDNLRLTKNGIKLMDFGAARDISYQSHSVILKLGYAPEEQYRSKGRQGPWTDVYALCATMYKCITGITPDESIERAVSDELKTPSALGININPTFEATLMRGLSVFQQDRYQSIDELLDGFMGDTTQVNSEGKTFIPQNESDFEDADTTFMSQDDMVTTTVADENSTQILLEATANQDTLTAINHDTLESNIPIRKKASKENDVEPEPIKKSVKSGRTVNTNTSASDSVNGDTAIEESNHTKKSFADWMVNKNCRIAAIVSAVIIIGVIVLTVVNGKTADNNLPIISDSSLSSNEENVDSENIESSELKIISHPQDVTTYANHKVSFSVEATGKDLKYQWYYKKKGDTHWSVWRTFYESTIEPPSNSSWNGLQVRCIVTDAYGNSETSKTAKVKLLSSKNTDFAILSHPKSVSQKRGKYRQVTFSVKAKGNDLKYQWYYIKEDQNKWSIWENKTSSVVKEMPDETWENMQVYCLITNVRGEELYSDIAVFMVK